MEDSRVCLLLPAASFFQQPGCKEIIRYGKVDALEFQQRLLYAAEFEKHPTQRSTGGVMHLVVRETGAQDALCNRRATLLTICLCQR